MLMVLLKKTDYATEITSIKNDCNKKKAILAKNNKKQQKQY